VEEKKLKQRLKNLERQCELEESIYKKYLAKFNKSDNIDESFFVAGLMLYLGEGDKKNKNRVNLANTDPKIIRFFIRWVVYFFDIDKKKIKIQLHLYENMIIDDEENFWKKKLGISGNQLYKSQIRKLKKNSFSYKSTNSHGTCSLYILNTKLKTEIMMAIKALLQKFC
jgi:hypothetical protein